MILAAYNLGPVVPITAPSGAVIGGIPILPFVVAGVVFVIYRVIRKPGGISEKLEEIPAILLTVLPALAVRLNVPLNILMQVILEAIRGAQAPLSAPVPTSQLSPLPPADPLDKLIADAAALYGVYAAAKDTARQVEAQKAHAALKALKTPPVATPPAAGTVIP